MAKSKIVAETPTVEVPAEVVAEKKKKKSKKVAEETEPVVEKRAAEETPAAEEPAKKKKKKSKTTEEEAAEEPAAVEAEAEEPKKEKKAKKSKKAAEEETEEPAAKKQKTEEKEEKAEEKAEEAEEKAPEKFEVIVFGISWEATEETVKKDFEECGEIVSFRMPTDRETGQSKGMCFVEYSTKEGMDAALAFSGTDYGGRTLNVRICEPDGNKGKGKGKDGKGKGKDGKGKGKKGGKGPSEKPDGCLSVVVKGMSWDTTEESLRAFLEPAGTIAAVKILTDRETGESKGMAFVDFEATESTDAAVKKSGSELDGRSPFIDFNVPREKGEGKGDKGGKKGDGKKGKGKGKGKKGGKDPIRAANQGSLVAGAGAAQTFSDSE